ncbi:tyrosine-type recombinase/integrase [Peribacillus frigoritolerans]|uniref:tyrosine-type recombinase/integrase n=1 Tax=Peribacillus frigoritolerans TaxID=450367 RepID=UPI002E1F4D64|nr:tyrosine-type recombinase/integrase [Peribacillus frigoritolerans]MED3789992.1 tyrosine-type recombinase/integrase [Peribacillus frigoritolerans]
MANLKTNGVKKAEQVEPIKNKKDLKKLVTYLKATNLRNYAIVVVGMNVLLRAGDLLELKWIDVIEDEMTFKRKIWITEEKTSKQREIRFNDDSIGALTLYRQSLNRFNVNDYIFTSRKVNKNGEKKLDVKALHKIIKDTCRELNIKGHFGTHTLRKTGAYHIYTNNIATNPTIITKLQKILNHSSQATTLRYIGIEAQEIDDIFDSLKLF